MAREPENAAWWRRLTRPSGALPPPSVTQRLAWYEKRVRRGRQSTYVLESAIILTSAAIPATAAAGGSAETTQWTELRATAEQSLPQR